MPSTIRGWNSTFQGANYLLLRLRLLPLERHRMALLRQLREAYSGIRWQLRGSRHGRNDRAQVRRSRRERQRLIRPRRGGLRGVQERRWTNAGGSREDLLRHLHLHRTPDNCRRLHGAAGDHGQRGKA